MPFKVGQKVISDGGIKISIKALSVSANQISQLELEFRDFNGKHTGDLIIEPGKLTWNRGKTAKTGKSIAWSELFKQLS